MSESKDESQEKTEEPSGRRLDEAREHGQIAKSQEITALLAIVSSLGILYFISSNLLRAIVNAVKGSFFLIAQREISVYSIWLNKFVEPVMKELLVFMVLMMLIAAFGNIFQTGFVLSWKALTPKPSHLNPLEGAKKMFSTRTLIQFAKSMAKVIVIGFIAYGELESRIDEILHSSVLSIAEAAQWSLVMLSDIVLKICIFLAVISVFDFLYQWWSIRKELMMSHKELKDEMKEQQLPENVRNKVRQVASEMAKQTIRKEVPNADVIVTNPTHYAVALRYKRFVDVAPRVVAKGRELLAKTIREVATEHQIPIYEYPVLARSLYRTVRVGEVIPRDDYEAVAQVLVYVYKLREKRKSLAQGMTVD